MSFLRRPFFNLLRTPDAHRLASAGMKLYSIRRLSRGVRSVALFHLARPLLFSGAFITPKFSVPVYATGLKMCPRLVRSSIRTH